LSERTRKLWRGALLVALLLLFAGLKANFDHGLGRRALDGDYYYQIARHVAEGDGMATSVSLYNQGFQSFPHRINQSPAWVLLLGYTGRWFGLDTVSRRLPEALYLAGLLALYFLANRLRRRLGDGGWLRADGLPDFGHVAVVVLGASPIYFRFSSLPYTEPMAFLLMFGSLLALDRAALERSAGWAVAAGLCAGVALLTRSQMLPLVIAAPVALAAAGLRERRLLVPAGACLAAALLPLVPWGIWLSTWIDPMTPGAVIGFADLSETPGLPVFAHVVATDSFGAWLLDRGRGLLVAFDPRHELSYVVNSGFLPYLVLVAPVHFVWTRRHSLTGVLRPPPETVLPLALLLCGAGMLIPVHMAHGTFFREWLFAHRHGLPILLLILPCLAYLCQAGRAARATAIALLLASAVWIPSGLYATMTEEYSTGLTPNEEKLVRWLGRHVDTPSVVTTRAQHLSVYSRVGFHWMLCKEVGEDQAMALMHYAGADYMVVYESQLAGCKFTTYRTRRQKFKHVTTFGKEGEGNRIMVFKLNRFEAVDEPPKLRPFDEPQAPGS